jgi:hypothetical protein
MDNEKMRIIDITQRPILGMIRCNYKIVSSFYRWDLCHDEFPNHMRLTNYDWFNHAMKVI